MSRDELSRKQRSNRLPHTSREVQSTPNHCLEVQWRFLQHKNPKLPQFDSTSRKPLIVDPLAPQPSSNSSSSTNSSVCTTRNSRPAPPQGSPSRLFHLFETQEVESDQIVDTPSASQGNTKQESRPAANPRACRAFNDLMGETQRQAMLDRILADMEYLAVEPTYSRLGHTENEEDMKVDSPRRPQRARIHKPSILQTMLRSDVTSPKKNPQRQQHKLGVLWALGSQDPHSDDDDDDDDDIFNDGETDRETERIRRRRRRRKRQQHNDDDQMPRIFWQPTTGARSAADVPEQLLNLSPSPPRRQRSPTMIMTGRPYRSRTVLGGRRTSTHGSTTLNDSPQAATIVVNNTPKPTVSPRVHRHHHFYAPITALSSPKSKTPAPSSPPKAHYGAWYVPQSEWWNLHQAEQQTIANKFPGFAAPSHSDTDEHQCHDRNSSPTQRQHKPPLPCTALSPRPTENSRRGSHLPSNGTAGSRMSSASSRKGAAPPSAPTPLEVQVAGIPQSYIGREYRAFILSTGSSVPQYLQ